MQNKNSQNNISDIIKRTSPLYTFWESSQNKIEHQKRLEKANKNFPAAGLFKKEPYKWEILYQSIIREIINGDEDSVKGLKILTLMLQTDEREKVINDLSNNNILAGKIIKELSIEEINQLETKKNIMRFIRILLAIFTNPYGIEVKYERTHIYEHTGYLINKFRR